MTDSRRNPLGRSSSHVAELAPGNSIRPRNRRYISPNRSNEVDILKEYNEDPGQLRSLRSPLPNTSLGGSRSTSPFNPPRPSNLGVGPTHSASTGNLGQFFSESWNQSWNSVQDLTSSIFSSGDSVEKRARGQHRGLKRPDLSKNPANNQSWGPAPPELGPKLDDVAAGSLTDRQSALKAARTASVLQSHEGVNGGLDISGKHKRRDSGEATSLSQGRDDYMVYIHHVRPEDTYAGLILRYKCHEDAFRRANGLWSRDSVQTRKWLTIPVDCCEIRGRPCEAPSSDTSYSVDLLAPTPQGDEDETTARETRNDYFSKSDNDPHLTSSEKAEEKPWAHVRWVKIDSIPHAVEIGRVSKAAMGYFPPRRKRSIKSSFSTPRQSSDISVEDPGSAGSSSRRFSGLGSRPLNSASALAARSRLGSDASDARPMWMREPGGVGTMRRNVKAPGPDKDYLNTWTRKHIPGLNIEGPSMSIMGSGSAHIGFGKDTADLVENHIQGKGVPATSQQGTPLDRAAAAVETWLRGALAKRPITPLSGSRSSALASHFGGDAAGDLIELADTASDDGRFNHETTSGHFDGSLVSGSRDNDESAHLRGRAIGPGPKGAKSD